MKQAILSDDGFTIIDVDVPKCSSDSAIIKTLGNGICSSDLFRYRSTQIRLGIELFLGHEASGVITEIGSDVADFAVGDYVTVLGGKFAEFSRVPAHEMVRLPQSLFPPSALGEPVACCIHAMNRAGINTSSHVAVVGCGFMGLVCLQVAKSYGASHIVAIDPNYSRRGLAKQLAADEVFAPDDLPVEQLRTKYGAFNGEYDIVIEAVGNQEALNLCGCLVKQHGLINIVGHHQSDNGIRTVDLNQWNMKAIDVVNGHVRRRDEKMEAMRQGIALCAQGKIVLDPMLSYYSLSNIQQAFDDCIHRKTGLVKAVIIP